MTEVSRKDLSLAEECQMDGHEWAVTSEAGTPVEIVCQHCGEVQPVGGTPRESWSVILYDNLGDSMAALHNLDRETALQAVRLATRKREDFEEGRSRYMRVINEGCAVVAEEQQ